MPRVNPPTSNLLNTGRNTEICTHLIYVPCAVDSSTLNINYHFLLSFFSLFFIIERGLKNESAKTKLITDLNIQTIMGRYTTMNQI